MFRARRRGQAVLCLCAVETQLCPVLLRSNSDLEGGSRSLSEAFLGGIPKEVISAPGLARVQQVAEDFRRYWESAIEVRGPEVGRHESRSEIIWNCIGAVERVKAHCTARCCFQRRR